MNKNPIYSYFNQLSDNDQAHCLRVEKLSVTLAKNLGQKGVNFEALSLAARFHDVGKILVPNCILNKPQKLNEAERQQIMSHPIYSSRFLTLSGFGTKVTKFALLHHENFDGSGYPFGLVGEDIPLEARIIRVADVYDALSSERVYKKAISCKGCLEQMEMEIHKFDFQVMEVLASHVHSEAYAPYTAIVR